MNTAYSQFKTIMQDTRSNTALYDYVNKVMKPPMDYSDLLRLQWIQSVSALDKLIHDFVRVGMCQIFNGLRPATNKFNSFSIDIDVHLEIASNPLDANRIFEQFIIGKFKSYSFQDPDKISDGLAYIWNEKHKWRSISSQMGIGEDTVKTELKNIATRRHQIVHEGDYILANLSRQNIEKVDVEEVMNFIEKIGDTIFNLVK